MRTARVIVAMVGVVVAAWFLLGARQAHDTTVAADIAQNGNLTRTEASRATGLLSSAALLNPDTQVRLIRAQVARDRGDVRRAVAILESVTAAEPLNADAWYALAQAGGAEDNKQVLARALIRISRLVPKVPAS